MTSCPVIVSENHPDIELSSYETVPGTYVVISCKGFGQHVANPTNVFCLSTGRWSPSSPNLTCRYALDDSEKLYLGIGIGCALLFLLGLIWIFCYFFCCHEKRRDRFNRWNRYFYKDPPPRYDADYRYPPSDPSIYGDYRRTRGYYVEEEPPVKIIEVEKPVPVITRYVEPEPEPVIEVIEKPVIYEPIVERYHSMPYVISSPRYVEPAEHFVSTLPRRQSYRVSRRIDPLVYDDNEPIILRYGKPSIKRTSSFNDYLPRARITEIIDDDSAFKSSSITASRTLMPTYRSSGHYEPIVLNSSTDYFSGRQDYNFGSRTGGDERELDHILYHGKGKMTEIYEDGSDFRKSRIL